MKQEEDKPTIDLTSDDEETGGNPGAKPAGKKNTWTDDEVAALKKGVSKYGESKHRSIF